jgi:lipopolysaccharide biosynthesis glycosyltransferase
MADLSLVFATDRRFRYGCTVAVRSTVDHLPVNVSVAVYVFHSKLTRRDKREIASAVQRDGLSAAEVHFIAVPDARLRGLRTMRFINRLMYARLCIGELLPAHVPRCIYLDTDIVVERDLTPLNQTSLDGAIVAACREPDSNFARVQLKKLGLLGEDFFNSGVLLVDLDRWREERVGEKVLEYCLENNPEFPDQSGLNVVLRDRWRELDGTWNAHVWASTSGDYHGKVLHFTSVPKPWDVDYAGRFSSRFYHYLDRTAAAGWRPRRIMGFRAALTRLRRRIPHIPGVMLYLRGALTRNR